MKDQKDQHIAILQEKLAIRTDQADQFWAELQRLSALTAQLEAENEDLKKPDSSATSENPARVEAID